MIKDRPDKLKSDAYRQDAFGNGQVLLGKKKGRLPAMGWNSWNAFGSGNTEALTKQMADAIVELGLNRLGYKYVVLDDGCYKQERIDGRLSNEEEKFPSGFKALADYIHARGLKFGMYNDIGTNLCAGAAVGTCGHEEDDAESYMEWGVDFLKVDNCYYLWDNATFSDAENARFVFAPNIKGIRLTGNGVDLALSAVKDAQITGSIARVEKDYVTFVGTYDGTGPVHSPAGEQSSEIVFRVQVPSDGIYELTVEYAAGAEEGVGSWLQAAVETGADDHEASRGRPLGYDDFLPGAEADSRGAGGRKLVYDDFLPGTETSEQFVKSPAIEISLQAGVNKIYLMNHRRQENTLNSYAALLEGLNKAKPDHDVCFSICEWGKTQPQNWGYKVGDSWRILNDITFQVGADGDPGTAHWKDDYTPSITSQYNKAVIMDAFAGLDKGWNDPDMMVIGMNGLTEEMNRTHMAMWCMMNAPLMLGLDLRRVRGCVAGGQGAAEGISETAASETCRECAAGNVADGLSGETLLRIIANEDLIALNQDALGVQAKRIYCSLAAEHPDQEYIRDIDRVDILAKPLADGSAALSFINVSETEKAGPFEVSVPEIVQAIGGKMVHAEAFAKAEAFTVKDLWSGQESVVRSTGAADGRNRENPYPEQDAAEAVTFRVDRLKACDNVTWRITPGV